MGSTIDVTSKSLIIPTQCMTHFTPYLITICSDKTSDKTSHVLTDTSLKFVISFRSYLRICDYGVSNRCDSNELYAPNSMYDYRTLRAASAQNNSKIHAEIFGILLAFFAEYNINYFSKLPKSKKFLLLTRILLTT